MATLYDKSSQNTHVFEQCGSTFSKEVDMAEYRTSPFPILAGRVSNRDDDKCSLFCVVALNQCETAFGEQPFARLILIQVLLSTIQTIPSAYLPVAKNQVQRDRPDLRDRACLPLNASAYQRVESDLPDDQGAVLWTESIKRN